VVSTGGATPETSTVVALVQLAMERCSEGLVQFHGTLSTVVGPGLKNLIGKP